MSSRKHDNIILHFFFRACLWACLRAHETSRLSQMHPLSIAPSVLHQTQINLHSRFPDPDSRTYIVTHLPQKMGEITETAYLACAAHPAPNLPHAKREFRRRSGVKHLLKRVIDGLFSRPLRGFSRSPL